MIEVLFEFSLNVIDNICLLWFYVLFIGDEKTHKHKMIYILGFSILQFVKDSNFDFGGLSVFIDCFLAVGMLFMYAKEKNTFSFLGALIMYSIEKFAVVFFVSTALAFSFDIQLTLIFGIQRIVFCVILKLFILLTFYILIKPLKRLSELMSYGAINIFSIIIIVAITCLSYVYGNSNGNEQIFFYTAFLTVILLFVYYMFYLYCKISKDFADSQTMNAMMEMTKDQIAVIDSEYEQYRKLRHDINNQLSILYNLQKQGHYTEVLDTLEKYHEDIEMHHSTLTSNIYLDAILRLKIKQYEDIDMDIELMVSKDIAMEGKEIISLLSNIIDNACEELYKTDSRNFKLSIKGDQTKLQIFAKNKTRNNHSLVTEKDTKFHGFGLKIIHEIVEKYEGSVDIKIDDFFIIKIFIIF